jgi:hypothetical protein
VSLPTRALPAIALTLLLLSTANAARARTWNVYRDGTGDAPTIQAAIDSTGDGDTVLVGPGIYEEGVIEIEYQSVSLIAVEGPSATSIQHLAAWGGHTQSRVVVEGFRFVPSDQELAPLVVSALLSFDIDHCVVQGYRKHGEIDNVMELSILDCDFIDNQDSSTTDGKGGGVLYISVPAHSYDGEIRRCRFIGNSTFEGVPNFGLGGGALQIRSGAASGFVISECLFLRNSAPSGGAVSLEGHEILFDRNTLVGNIADDGAVLRHLGGGGRTYCNIFAWNQTNGLYNLQSAHCRCNAYWENQGWGPNDGQWVGSCEGIGDREFYVDPLFCDPEADDFRLRENSPLIPENFPAGMESCEGIIGAFGVGCEPQPVLPVTWGRLKSLYSE